MYLSKLGKWVAFLIGVILAAVAYWIITLSAELYVAKEEVAMLRENVKLVAETSVAHQKLADMYLKIGASYKDVLTDIMDKLDRAKVTLSRGSAVALLERLDSITIGQARAAIGGP